MELENDLGLIWQQVASRYDGDIAALKAEHEQLRAEYAGRMDEYAQRVQHVWQAIRQELGISIPYLDNYALPQPAYAEEVGDGLYNTERDYLEQLEAYKTFQGKLQLQLVYNRMCRKYVGFKWRYEAYASLFVHVWDALRCSKLMAPIGVHRSRSRCLCLPRI